jgi:hypothetical protein
LVCNSAALLRFPSIQAGEFKDNSALHGDVGRAVIGLAGFVNGDDVRVVDAPRGTRLILKAQQEVRVIEKLAAQDFERHGAVANRDLLGEEDRTHAARAQAADNAKSAGQLTGKLRLGLRGLSGKASPVAGTELNVVGVSMLASGAGLHERQ